MKQESVNHPPHYGGEDNPYEAIKVIEAWGLGFCLGNVVKYLSRAGKKGDALEDLRKARWYLDREIGALEVAEDASIGAIGDRILDYYRTKEPIDAMPPKPTAQPHRQTEFWLTCNDTAQDPVCTQDVTKVFLGEDAPPVKDRIVFTHVFSIGLHDWWEQTSLTPEQFNDVRETEEIRDGGATIFSGVHKHDGRKRYFKGYYADGCAQARDAAPTEDRIVFTYILVNRHRWCETSFTSDKFHDIKEVCAADYPDMPISSYCPPSKLSGTWEATNKYDGQRMVFKGYYN